MIELLNYLSLKIEVAESWRKNYFIVKCCQMCEIYLNIEFVRSWCVSSFWLKLYGPCHFFISASVKCNSQLMRFVGILSTWARIIKWSHKKVKARSKKKLPLMPIPSSSSNRTSTPSSSKKSTLFRHLIVILMNTLNKLTKSPKNQTDKQEDSSC